MTPSEWEQASALQRNIAIGLALGWKWRNIPWPVNPVSILSPPNFAEAEYADTPQYATKEIWAYMDWAGSDSVAFGLWPEILKLRSDAALMFAMGNVPAVLFHDDTADIEADTWSAVLCRAFLALKK